MVVVLSTPHAPVPLHYKEVNIINIGALCQQRRVWQVIYRFINHNYLDTSAFYDFTLLVQCSFFRTSQKLSTRFCYNE